MSADEFAEKADAGVRTVANQAARLALTGLALGARVKQADNGFYYELRNAAAPGQAASWRAEPKVYRALLTQAGTNAPVATVLENTLGADVVWTYQGTGNYTAQAAFAFPAQKTFCSTGFTVQNGHFGRGYTAARSSDHDVTVRTFESGDFYDDYLNADSFEILVYP